MAKIINIYTDGACSGNQHDENTGGWGCVLEYMSREKELHGGEINTTNNRMELSALISALDCLKEKGLILKIFSDSSYLVNCFRDGWYKGWIRNGWKNSKKEPVENRELWERLLELLDGNEAEFFLVKGHIKNPSENDYARFVKHNGQGFSFERFAEIIAYNNRCDALANIFIKEHKSQ